MKSLDPITLTAGQSSPVSLIPGTVAALIANESPLSIQVNLSGQTRWLPAWTLDLFDLSGMTAVGGQLSFMPQSLSSSLNSPSSVILVTLVQSGDKVTGTYPCSLTRQTNIGNGVIPTTGTNTVINDGSAAGTTVVETTPQGQSTSAFSLDNSGNVTLRTLVASVWSVVFQTVSNGSNVFHGTADTATNVAATGVTAGALAAGVTMAAGQITQGNLGIGTGKITSDNGAHTTDGSGWENSTAFTATGTHNNGTGNYAFAGGAVYFDSGGFRSTGSGSVTMAQLKLNTGTAFLNGVGYFSGTGSGTVSHGAGATPNWVGITDSQGGSSATVGAASYTSTQVTITLGASHTWKGIAIS